jgi:hypothetical protein
MAQINLEQEVDALEANLETVTSQRDELIDLLDEILTGGFLKLERWVNEAADTVHRMKRNRR